MDFKRLKQVNHLIASSLLVSSNCLRLQKTCFDLRFPGSSMVLVSNSPRDKFVVSLSVAMGGESNVARIVLGELSDQFLAKIAQSVHSRSPAFHFFTETLVRTSENYNTCNVSWDLISDLLICSGYRTVHMQKFKLETLDKNSQIKAGVG